MKMNSYADASPACQYVLLHLNHSTSLCTQLATLVHTQVCAQTRDGIKISW